jgi:hypothetical protein
VVTSRNPAGGVGERTCKGDGGVFIATEMPVSEAAAGTPAKSDIAEIRKAHVKARPIRGSEPRGAPTRESKRKSSKRV